VSILVFWKEKKKISTLVPWIQLGLVGFLASLITAVGYQSAGIASAAVSRYITMSNLLVISFIVVLFLVFVTINNHFRKKEVKVVITASVVFIFIIGGVLMNSVYLEGWNRGNIEHTKRIDALSCFSIPMKTERCNDLYPVKIQSRFFKLANLLPNLNLSPFSYLDLDFIRGNDPFFDKKNWKPLNENIQIFGKIETVNEENVTNKSIIEINKSTVTIDGWLLDQNKKTVDKFYLFVNDKPFLRFDDYPRLPGIDGSYRDHFEGTMKKLWNQRPDLQKHFPEVENNNYSEFEVWVRNEEPPSLKEFIFGTFVPRPDVVESLGSGSDLNSGWKLQFFTNYLEEGCHELSLGIISNGEKALIDSPAQICVEYKYPFIRK